MGESLILRSFPTFVLVTFGVEEQYPPAEV